MSWFQLFRSVALVAVLSSLAACAGNVQFDSAERQRPTRLTGILTKPEGNGPFPAMVLAHGCGGIRANIPMWAEWFKERGFVTLAPDSLGPRGVTSICENLIGIVNQTQRVNDVYGAARHLATLPYVDRSRIGVMGFSNGAITALDAVRAWYVQINVAPDTPRFQVSIPLYPECMGRERPWAVPVLILIGDRDDWTRAASCTNIHASAGEPPFEVKVLPGALHGFDEVGNPERFLPSVMNVNSRTSRGASVGGSAQATEQAKREIAAFLGKHMNARP